MISQFNHTRYVIQDRLGAGAMGAVYRAQDRLTGDMVALKQVNIATQHLTFASRPETDNTDELRLALAREFQTLASLRHPHIISVLDYGFSADGHPFFTMTLLDNPQTIIEYSIGKSITQKADLLIQILAALTYLHRREMLHRDIKPANVLVNPDGQVKVLDFGLSASADQAKGVAGTLAYMAPEVIRGGMVSPASDIYAVGMIAYELFIGAYPFQTTNPTRLMTQIISQYPDLSSLNHPTLEAVLMRWLHKDPQDRYSSAEKVIADLCHALDIPLPSENTAIRESFLQSAQFIGREAELAQLMQAFDQAQAGQGGIWLVNGESGVGKSRLVDELRIRALTKGVLVLQGQSVEIGSLPYQLWREMLPKLLLTMPISPTEASILKEIIPTIGTLLGYAVEDAPPVDAQSRQTRLKATTNQLLMRQTMPILMILDDLQWAGVSLDLLKSIIPSLTQLPILIIGVYRDEERPQLPDELGVNNIIHLKRFDKPNIEALSSAMLGDVGKKADVVTLLNQETEGNVFFLIEVVRALAEEAGNLSLIGEKTLPNQVFTGGIKTIIARRLSKLPPALNAVTQLAAIMGREIDLALLTHHYEADFVDEWLIISAGAMILEIRENKWRFAHDKLREGALQDMPKSLHKKFHLHTAQAIEAVYPDNPDYHRALLEHWHEAGDIQKEVHYLKLVVKRDLDVIGIHQRVHSILDRTLNALADTDSARMTLLNLRARAHILAAQYDQAITTAEQAHTLAKEYDDPYEIADSLYILAEIASRKGDLEQAKMHITKSLMMGESLEDYRHIARCKGHLGMTSYRLGEFDQAQTCFEQALKIYQTTNDSHGQGLATLYLGYVASIKQDNITAQQCYATSLDYFKQVGDLRSQGIAMGALGGIYFNEEAYDTALNYYQQSLEIAHQTGNQFGVAVQKENLGRAYCAKGDYVQGMDYLNQVLAYNRQVNNKVGIVYNLNNIGIFAFEQGDYLRAKNALTEAMMMLTALGDKMMMVNVNNNLGFVYALQGDIADAKSHFITALPLAHDIGYDIGTYASILGMAWVYLGQGQPQRAGEIIVFVQKHAPQIGYMKTRIQQLVSRLEVDNVSGYLQEDMFIDIQDALEFISADMQI